MKKSQYKMGLASLTALVTANMMGSGVFMLPANLAQIGSISIFGWFISLIGVLAIAFIFATLGTTHPKAGGPYAYTKEGFGDYLGFQSVYLYWLSAWIGNIAIVIVCVSYLSHFFSLLGLPWASCAASIGLIWFFTLINACGAKTVGKIQLLTTTAMLVPILIIAIFGWFWFSPHLFISTFNVSGSSNFSAISNAASLTLWAFIGIESAVVSADVVEDPQRNVPLATLLGALIAACAYILSTTVMMGIVPKTTLANSLSPFAMVAEALFGPFAGHIICACAIMACLGTLSGWTLVIGQSAKAAADDGLFPAIFSKTNKRNMPVYGLIIVAVLISCILLLMASYDLTQQFNLMSLTAVFLILLPYLYSSIAFLIIRYREGVTKKELRKIAMVSLVASCYCFWALLGAGEKIVYLGTFILLMSVPLYVWVLWHKKQTRQAYTK